MTHYDSDQLNIAKSVSAAQLDRLFAVIDRAETMRKQLLTLHPEWARHAGPSDFLRQDARLSVFRLISVVCGTAQLSYLSITDNLGYLEWWRRKWPNITTATIENSVREYMISAKFALLLSLSAGVEEFLRSIVVSGPRFEICPQAEYKNLYSHVLSVTSQTQFEPIFDVLRVTRNAQHTNGIHWPRSGKSLEFRYAGKIVNFKVGEQLNWLSEENAVWLVSEIEKALETLVRCEPIESIDYSPRSIAYQVSEE